MFGRLLGWYIMYTFSAALAPYRILPGAKFTLRPSLALSCIGSVTARHSSSGRQPNFVAWYKEWNYGTLAESATYIRLAAITLVIGPHSSYYVVATGFFSSINIFIKAKFNYAMLVADRSEAARRPAASWNLACHALSTR